MAHRVLLGRLASARRRAWALIHSVPMAVRCRIWPGVPVIMGADPGGQVWPGGHIMQTPAAWVGVVSSSISSKLLTPANPPIFVAL